MRPLRVGEVVDTHPVAKVWKSPDVGQIDGKPDDGELVSSL
jgi:hypothetical protein